VTAPLAAGLVLALGSAVALNWGFFAQQGAAAALPPLSLRRPVSSLAALFAARRWLAGFLVGISGWALYVAALRLAPLSLVQATSAGGIGLLALFVARLGNDRLGRLEWGGVAAALLGLVLLAISLIGHTPSSGTGSSRAVSLWLAASLAIAAAFAWRGGRVLAPGAGLGIAAGVLYAAGDVGTKAALGGGARLLFVPALLACHGLAFAALQLGFQRGGPLETAGLATVWTNALPIVAGALLFGDSVPSGGLGAVRIGAFVLVVLGAAALAMRQHGADAPAAGIGGEPAAAYID
jgi:hypothetical protein